MDLKAMAKSKRLHTKHHQPKKPLLPKTPSTSSSSASSSTNDPKHVNKEARERKRPTQALLPSNWDRYDETPVEEGEEQEGQQEVPNSSSEEPTQLVTNKAEVVKPKSKGADFGYLISQAKSELQSKCSSTFGDVLPDFYQGFGPMLSMKGEQIVSWTGGDNFLDDEASPVQEAPFLSLNLKALAEKLAKADLAKRLFIEADLLPPELQVQDTEDGNLETPVETLRSQESETAARTSTEFIPQSSGGTKTIEDQSVDSFSSDETNQGHALQASPGQSKKSFDYAGRSEANHVADLNDRLLPFEATAAEAELDMLLDSLGVASEVGNSFKNDERTFASPFEGKSSIYVTPSKPTADQDLSRCGFRAASFNDAVDDLLDKTSDLMNKDGVFPPSDIKSISVDGSSSSSSHRDPKSKVLEDFDSWFDTL